jgi:hypothetical protein
MPSHTLFSVYVCGFVGISLVGSEAEWGSTDAANGIFGGSDELLTNTTDTSSIDWEWAEVPGCERRDGRSSGTRE